MVRLVGAVAAAFLAGAASVPAASGLGAGAPDAVACQTGALHTSFVPAATDPTRIGAVTVRGLDLDCEGWTVHVVVEGRAGSATVDGPATTVPIPGGVSAASVTQLVVDITPSH